MVTLTSPFWPICARISLRGRNEIGLRRFQLVLAGVEVALGRSFVIVESDAGRDDVDQREAAMRERGFEDRDQLFFVAGEAAGDERRADAERRACTGSMGAMRLGSPFLLFEPTSAEAENWPLVSPYTPLFSMT